MSMTIKEAIHRIKNHMAVHHIGEGRHIYIKEALDMAIDSLRKQDEQVKPKTNADRIRAMSDQELAAYWAENHDNFCQNKPECGEALNRDELIPDEWCVACALAWLQKPVEEPQLPVRFHMDRQESGLLEED